MGFSSFYAEQSRGWVESSRDLMARAGQINPEAIVL